VRTNEGNFAFIVIQDVSLYRPTEINDIELRWTVWQAATS
jgi:hypothetical protein